MAASKTAFTFCIYHRKCFNIAAKFYSMLEVLLNVPCAVYTFCLLTCMASDDLCSCVSIWIIVLGTSVTFQLTSLPCFP
jgi:hypothetical protein